MSVLRSLVLVVFAALAVVASTGAQTSQPVLRAFPSPEPGVEGAHANLKRESQEKMTARLDAEKKRAAKNFRLATPTPSPNYVITCSYNGAILNCAPIVAVASPSPSPTPATAYQTAVLVDKPWLYLRMASCTGTEPDLGSGGNAATYVGTTGLRCASGLTGDAGAASYSPQGSASAYARIAAPVLNYPTSKQISLEAIYRVAPGDVGATYLGSQLLSNRDPLTATNGADWGLAINGDSIGAHAEGQWAARGAADDSAINSLLKGSIYHIVATYDMVTGNRQVMVNGTRVYSAVAQANYFAAWPSGTNTTPPIIIGAFGDNVVSGNSGGINAFGNISDVAIYTTALTPTQAAAHYAAIGVAPAPGTSPSPTASASPTPTPSPSPTAAPSTQPSPSPSPSGSATPLPGTLLSEVQADKPISYWRMNQATGVEPDLGSTNNPLTITGGTRNLGPITSGTGANSYSNSPGGLAVAKSPFNAYPSSSQQITEEGWITPSQADLSASYIRGTLLDNTSPTFQSSATLAINGGASVGSGYAMAQLDGTNVFIKSADGSIIAGRLYHLVSVYDKSASSLKLYVNGALAASASVNYPGAFTGTNNPFFVGCSGSRTTLNTCDGNAVSGQLSELAIYATALSAARVSAHYVAGSTGVPTPPPPTPAPTPTAPPTPFAAPKTVNGTAVTLTEEDAVCIDGTEHVSNLPRVPNTGTYGTAAGHRMGEFSLYPVGSVGRDLLDLFWGSGSIREGSVGAYQQQLTAHLAAPVVVPPMDGTVDITVDQASPANVAIGDQIQVGRGPWADGQGNNPPTQDPYQINGILSSGLGTTTWHLTRVRGYNSAPLALAPIGITIAAVSPGYKTATQIFKSQPAAWPGWQESFGRRNGAYSNYAGDRTDGTGMLDPFSIMADPDVVGNPVGLRISAVPVPAAINYPNKSTLMESNGIQTVTGADTVTTAAATWPAEGGTLTGLPINGAPYQNDFEILVGQPGSGKVIVGVVASGAYVCDHNTGAPCQVNNGPYTIAAVHYLEGSQNSGTGSLITTIPAGTRLFSVAWAPFYSGALDKQLDFGYGALSFGTRFPMSQKGNSWAVWTLQSNAGWTPSGIARNEDDIGEQFQGQIANHGLNAGNLLWESDGPGIVKGYWQGDGANGDKGGSYSWPSYLGTAYPDVSYHEYTGTWLPGGQPAFPTDFSNTVANSCCVPGIYPTTAGDSFFLDRRPMGGHTGTTDLTQGVKGKETIAVFQTTGGGSNTVTTTTTPFTITAAYASKINVKVNSLVGWIQMAGQEYDFQSPDATINMRGFLASAPNADGSLDFYAKADISAPVNSTGSVMPVGSYVRAQNALSVSWPQYGWVSHIRSYDLTSNTCTI
ncbi:MAG: hypothetical protein NVSMB31_01240 [Vulcanimicrobiaceae bacterium]